MKKNSLCIVGQFVNLRTWSNVLLIFLCLGQGVDPHHLGVDLAQGRDPVHILPARGGVAKSQEAPPLRKSLSQLFQKISNTGRL